MGLVKEFKEFALKGSVLDLAIGVIIGGAFGKVVTSFVDDILMPPLGLLIGHHDFKDYALQLGGATIRYGLFVNTLINFLIIAFAIFVIVKRINAMKRAPAAETPAMKECPECLSPIPAKARRCKFCASQVAA